MKVILQSDVKGLGRSGDTVEVAPGYGRNYLIPRGLAVAATQGNVRQAEHRVRARARQAAREAETAREQAAALEGLTVTIRARAGEGGRLFGSVTAQDVADAVRAARGLELDKRRIELDEPIKALGEHRVVVRLHPGVQATVKVNVAAEES